jgi:hypothetical protein
MTWNLHVVGEKELDDVAAIGQAIVKVLEDAGHTLVSADLTTDVGTAPLPVAPPVDPNAPPAAVPVDTPPTPPETPPADTSATVA